MAKSPSMNAQVWKAASSNRTVDCTDDTIGEDNIRYGESNAGPVY